MQFQFNSIFSSRNSDCPTSPFENSFDSRFDSSLNRSQLVAFIGNIVFANNVIVSSHSPSFESPFLSSSFTPKSIKSRGSLVKRKQRRTFIGGHANWMLREVKEEHSTKRCWELWMENRIGGKGRKNWEWGVREDEEDEEDEVAWRREDDGTTSLALMRAIQLPQCTSNTISPLTPPPHP